MVLIIGGVGQGKLNYALSKSGADAANVAEDFSAAHTAQIFYGLHSAVRRSLEQGFNPYAETDALVAANPGVIIICDEIGGGLVPIEPGQRLWRDTVGRICCKLAETATDVERVFCGIPLSLKGDGLWN